MEQVIKDRLFILRELRQPLLEKLDIEYNKAIDADDRNLMKKISLERIRLRNLPENFSSEKFNSIDEINNWVDKNLFVDIE